MKKILLATTALAAVSVVSAAQAQESNMMSAAGNEVTIGGFYEFGYSTFDEGKSQKNADSSRTFGDSELILDFENTSDSGLTYGVHLEMEVIGFDQHNASQVTNNTDEANIYLSGDFGRVNLGHNDSAYDAFLTWAPTHSGATSQDDNAYGVSSLGYEADGTTSRGSVAAPYTAAPGTMSYGDDAKIAYFSPNFSGFSFGVSIEDNDAKGNPSAFGASYSTELGDVGALGGTTFGITYAYASNGKSDEKDPADATILTASSATESSIGVSVGLGDLAITVANYSGKGNGTNNKEITRKNLEFGVGYTISDSLSVALSRSTGTAKKVSGGFEDEGTYTTLSGGYTIAPGLSATLAINQFDNTRTTTATKAKTSNDGQEVTFQVNFAF